MGVPASLWYRHVLRVRYQESDQMGVVYHANYANWFELGRTELIRQMGVTYRELEGKGLILPVTDLQMTFRKPARYDDVIAVYTRIVSFTNVQLHFESQVRTAPAFQLTSPPALPTEEPTGELLVTGGTKHVWLDHNWKVTRIDRTAPELFALLTGKQMS
jgi:acyl-CoA thioester hydrolase